MAWPDKSVLVCILSVMFHSISSFVSCLLREKVQWPDSGHGRVMTVHHNTGHWRDENTECGDSEDPGLIQHCDNKFKDYTRQHYIQFMNS